MASLPSQGAGNQGAGYRPGAADRSQPQYDGSGAEQGRNSPQPSTDREGGDPDKAFKDLRMFLASIGSLLQ